ncbi:hypothetical protein AgCh_014769 [Apium graveolens]
MQFWSRIFKYIATVEVAHLDVVESFCRVRNVSSTDSEQFYSSANLTGVLDISKLQFLSLWMGKDTG